MAYEQIVMIQGEEGRTLVDALYDVDGVVAHGATEESIDAAVAHLSQWDYGDNPVDDSPAWGTSDDVWEHAGYVLSANLGLGYIALARAA